MTRTERLLALLQFLRSKRLPITASELAVEFAVSERTIYRDIQTLAGQGAAILGEAGVGYILRDDFFLPPLSFDREEAAAIMLGLRFVLRRGDSAQGAAAEAARAKLAAVTPEQFSVAEQLAAPLLVGPSPPAKGQTLERVRGALMRERKLAIEYIDAAGVRSRRMTWPVALGWFEDSEMLAAWCEYRNAFRHFRIDRLAHAQIVDERPPVPRSRLLARYKETEPGIEL